MNNVENILLFIFVFTILTSLRAAFRILGSLLQKEPKPIQFNPENIKPIEHMDLATNTGKSTRDKILEEVYNNK